MKLLKYVLLIGICFISTINLIANNSPIQSSIKSPIKLPIQWKTTNLKFTNSKVGDTLNLVFKATMKNDFYMYATGFSCSQGPIPTTLKLTGKGFKTIGNLQSIGAHPKLDKDWNCNMIIFDKEVLLSQKIVITKNNQLLNYKLKYFTCKTNDSCIPGKKYGKIIIGNPIDKIESGVISKKTASKSVIDKVVSSEEKSSKKEQKKSWILYLLTAFMAGLLTVFMPCIFPLMPMTVSYFSKGNKSRLETIKKAFIYGLSIVIIYTALAILPSLLLGSDRVNNWISTHWLPNILFFLVFVLFGLSFLGAFELKLPYKWANKADNLSEKGGYLGLFFMALTLIIVSFSCTGPFISSILILSSKGGISIKPFLGMLSYSIGFALPFVLLALTPQLLSKLPKSGAWMNTIKVFFGILELGLSLKFLSNIDLVYGWGFLDRSTFLSIWAVLSLLLAFYLLGFIKFSHDDDTPIKLSVGRFLMATFILFSTIYFITGIFDRPVNALSGLIPPKVNNYHTTASKNNLCETPLYSSYLHSPAGFNGYFDLEQAKKCAKKQGKMLLIDFTGHGCANCRKMEDTIWVQPNVKFEIENNYIVVSLYVDDKHELPKKDHLKDLAGYDITTVGEKNLFLEKSLFNEVSQPLYVTYNPITDKAISKIGYTSDVNEFVSFLTKKNTD
ncbi:protein-disulfide reductase DsbD family protein [Tenacibaculum finnmarkense]|uniref:protein-disulfide reductase DsbD family protein n=1 Tax=Tenacibaculum finnmarkense TaxID=2781243 RepID=UPI001EFB7A63|nr:cytochrome c biogenesis protein CcdA [Tenacibaculum finnmarkense]MCG8858361.1 disulfide bond formation protein DsbD [Tenacibaculum finnmarkense]